MPAPFARPVPAYFRALGLAAATGLALLAPAVATAQQAPGVFAYKWNAAIPADMITPADVLQGLIWTGHAEVPGPAQALQDIGGRDHVRRDRGVPFVGKDAG